MALLAATATAYQTPKYWQPQQSYQSPNPYYGGYFNQYQQPYSPYQQSYSPYQQSYSPYQQSYSPYQQSYHQPHSHHSHHSHHNPWDAEPADDEDVKSGWYSKYSQYSPPKIQFTPQTGSEPVYAQCVMPNDLLTIDFLQMPHQPTMIRGETDFNAGIPEFNGFTAIDLPFGLRIYEYGRFGLQDACENTGDEFNPLAEFNKYTHVRNPFQDPARGRLPDLSEGDVDDNDTNGIQRVVPDDEFLLQNLDGHDGIIGRSVILALKLGEITDDAPEDAEINFSCCIIARVEDPSKHDEHDHHGHDHHGHDHHGHDHHGHDHGYPTEYKGW